MDSAVVAQWVVNEQVGQVLVWAAVLLAAILLLGVLVLGLRRVTTQRRSADSTEGFSIEQLESLRRNGQVSDEEFKRLRRALLGAALPARVADDGRDAAGPPADNDGNCPSSSQETTDDI